MIKKATVGFFVCIVLAGPLSDAAHAQRSSLMNPISTILRRQYEGVIELVVRAAEKMPAEFYEFKPTPEVRTFGQLVGHIAIDQFQMCSAALGIVDPPLPKVDLRSAAAPKADLQKALKDGIDYCAKAYAYTDEQLAESVPERRVGVRIQPLIYNAGHNYEHYGNMVTYMRMKGLVPPSSERPEIEERLQGTPPVTQPRRP